MRERLAIILILLASGLVMLAANSGSSVAQVATFTPIPPTNTPRPPTATSVAPGCDNPLPVAIGGQITLRPGVNIRAFPSLSAPWLANYNENRIFTVLDGPVCSDEYIWWQVSNDELTGWVAESSAILVYFRTYDPVDEVVCRTPLVLTVGEAIELVDNVRLRTEPGLDGRVLTVAPSGSVITILNPEPTCANGYNWWQVNVTVLDVEYTGWMVEGRRLSDEQEPSFIALTPAPAACARPLAASPGDTGRVRYVDRTPKNLRAEPNIDSELLFTLVENVPLEIVSGPVCSEGMNFWQVRVLASEPVIGWLAEGAPPNYWIRITNDIGAQAVPTRTPRPTGSPVPRGNLAAASPPSLNPSPPTCLTNFQASVVVSNTSPDVTTDNIARVTFRDVLVRTGDVVAVNSGTVPVLAPGSTFTVAVTFNIGTFYNEEHRIEVVIDSENTVRETNEDDNFTSTTYVLQQGPCS